MCRTLLDSKSRGERNNFTGKNLFTLLHSYCDHAMCVENIIHLVVEIDGHFLSFQFCSQGRAGQCNV